MVEGGDLFKSVPSPGSSAGGRGAEVEPETSILSYIDWDLFGRVLGWCPDLSIWNFPEFHHGGWKDHWNSYFTSKTEHF